MSLKNELCLKKAIAHRPHEALLSIYYTASCLRKRADVFFRRFGLTDVQFNLMMLLRHQCGAKGGLNQARLSDMMLVNRANITSLIDRMEKSELVIRTAEPEDRRYNVVKLTAHGRRLLAQVEPLYTKEIKKIIATLRDPEQKRLITALEKIRSNIEEQSTSGKLKTP